MFQVASSRRGFNCLTNAENELLERYLEVLEPFKCAIVMLEFREQPTISWLYIIITGLLSHIEDINKDLPEIRKLCETLEQQLRGRFEKVLQDNLFVVASLIDPATSHLLKDEAFDKAKMALIGMMNESNSLPTGSQTTLPQSQPAPTNSFLQCILAPRSAGPSQTSGTLTVTVDAYLSAIHSKYSSVGQEGLQGKFSEKSLEIIGAICVNPRFYGILQVAKKILAIPATSSPVEGIFSMTGLCTHGNKANTEAELLNAKILVHLNPSE